MNGTLRLSEAFTLGLHAACYLAGLEEGRASTREMARYLGVSEAHLAKVLQRLARAGILKSARGPGGGFRLGRRGSEISLMDIYESLEGPFSPTTCLLGRESCLGRSCVLEELLRSVDEHFESYLRMTDLDMAGAMLRENGDGNAFPKARSSRSGRRRQGTRGEGRERRAGPGPRAGKKGGEVAGGPGGHGTARGYG